MTLDSRTSILSLSLTLSLLYVFMYVYVHTYVSVYIVFQSIYVGVYNLQTIIMDTHDNTTQGLYHFQ